VTFAAVGAAVGGEGSGLSSFSLTPHAVGDLILIEVVCYSSGTFYPTALSSSNVTWSAPWVPFAGTVNIYRANVFIGNVTAASAATVTISYSGSVSGTMAWAGQEFSSTVGAWAADGSQGNLDSSGTADWPSLTPSVSGDIYFGYSFSQSGSSTAGSTSGYTYNTNCDTLHDCLAYNPACGSGATFPVWGKSDQGFGIMVLVKETPATAVIPCALRDARRDPKVPPRSNIGEGWLQGISQPPLPPGAFRESRRPVRLPPKSGIASWLQGISQPPIPPSAEHAARRPVRLPPPGHTASWDQGISQPPVPPQAVRDVRRPVRIPPRSGIASWDQPQAPQPVVPQAVRAARRIRLPWRSFPSWLQGISQPPIPPSAEHAARRPARIPPRSNITGWDKGISQPPVPPQAVRDTRWPLRFRRALAIRPPERAGNPGPVAVHAARRPPRFPLHEVQAQPGGGIQQPPVPPQAVRGARRPVHLPPWRAAIARFAPAPSLPSAEHAARRPAKVPPRGSAAVKVSGGIAQPPVPPAAVRAARRIRLPWRQSAARPQSGGASQPPALPRFIRAFRRPVRIPPPRSTALLPLAPAEGIASWSGTGSMTLSAVTIPPVSAAASWSGTGLMQLGALSGPGLPALWAAYLQAKQAAIAVHQELSLARGAYATDGQAYVIAAQLYALDRAADEAYRAWALAAQYWQQQLGVLAWDVLPPDYLPPPGSAR
jgi:hypothetical protein